MKRHLAHTHSYTLLLWQSSLSASDSLSGHRHVYSKKHSFTDIIQREQICRHTVSVCGIVTLLLRRTYTMNNHRSNFTPSKLNNQNHAIRGGFTNFGFVCEILFLKTQNITYPNTLTCAYTDCIL